jgi:hypothetical protein
MAEDEVSRGKGVGGETAPELIVTVSPISGEVTLDTKGLAALRLNASASGGTAPYSYQWRRNQAAIAGATNERLDRILTSEDLGATFDVVVHDAASSAASKTSDPLTVSIAPADDAPVIWTVWFALVTGIVALGATALLVFPLWRGVKRGTDNLSQLPPHFPASVALDALLLGTVLAVAAVYLMLLEFRGRARTAEQILAKPPASPELVGMMLADGAAAGDIAKSLPQIVDSFGKLKAPAALLVACVALFICGAAVAWRAIPESNGGASTGTSSTTASTTSSAEITTAPAPAPAGTTTGP